MANSKYLCGISTSELEKWLGNCKKTFCPLCQDITEELSRRALSNNEPLFIVSSFDESVLEVY